MARSRKKNPGGGIAASMSDKPFKVFEHRRERRATKIAVAVGDDPPSPKEFGNPWNAPKDGKQWWGDHDDKWMRK